MYIYAKEEIPEIQIARVKGLTQHKSEEFITTKENI